jgi:hypothetical protein
MSGIRLAGYERIAAPCYIVGLKAEAEAEAEAEAGGVT